MPTIQKILILDDEENVRWVLKKALEQKRFSVDAAATAEEALKKIESNRYLLVFSDIFLDGMSGLEFLEQARCVDADLKVVVMTAQNTMNNTIDAMSKGAFDYISKPFNLEDIYSLANRALKSHVEPTSEVPSHEPSADEDLIIGKSKKMQDIFKTIGKSAPSDLPVLITGESGVGKELVARSLHNYSNRADQSLVSINCAAISRELLESELFGHEKGSFTGAHESKVGRFEQADGGTIFLDEIGDMEPSLQAKILRVLQNHEFYRVGGKVSIRVDARIIAATNQDLKELIEQKRFREDLFHRLNVLHIDLPPLRERQEDIPLLAREFINRFGSRKKAFLTREVENIFYKYSWPGNIRELENIVKRSLVLAVSGPILPDHLPTYILEESEFTPALDNELEMRLDRWVQDYLRQNPGWEQRDDLYERVIQMLEKRLLTATLDKFSGKQVGAAKALGINRNTLKRKIDSMNLSFVKKPSKT